MFDSAEVKKKKNPPAIFIELCDQRDGGWVLDGTERTANEVRMKTPSAEFIPSRGFRLVQKPNPETGEMEWQNEEIRYISNSLVLSVEEQKRKGIMPAKNKLEDKIIVKSGVMSVVREGKFVSLYEYLTQVFYNESNPNRPSTAKSIFRVVVPGKKDEGVNDNELAVAQAKVYLGSLYSKDKSGDYHYNEDKINSLCSIFLVYAETMGGKIRGLMTYATQNPISFMDIALKAESSIETNIGYAIDLNIIRFEGNTAVYVNKDKVLADIGKGKLSHEKKVEKLRDALGSDEYSQAYEELKIEIEAEQERKKRN